MDTTNRPPAKDPEFLRKKVLEDPNTAQIAEKLGVPLEEYVNQVVQFALNPNQEPELYIVEDEALREAGFEPPDADAMGQYIVEAVTLAEAGDKTEFVDGTKKKLVHLDVPPTAEVAGSEDPQLKAEADKLRRAGPKS